jgi:hypothetical protein
MCYGNWAHIDDILHKFLAALCVPPMVARQRVGNVSFHSVLGNGSVKNVPAATMLSVTVKN